METRFPTERQMRAVLYQLWTDESGRDSDHALFIALVAILLIVAFGPFRKTLAARFASAAAVLRTPAN
jgi:Flp pilus assembly pilin Flp